MDYKFIDKSVWLEKEKILVIADLHLGYEESLENIALPRTQFKKIKEDLGKIFEIVGKAKKIIILGDLKHNFSGNINQEWREVSKLLEYLKENCEEIILVKGNHDNYLMNVVKNIDKVKLVDFYIESDKAFIHGDKKIKDIENKKIKTVFAGHSHPAISIREGVKEETFKCFLVGKWKDKEVVILPSFFPLVEGYDVELTGNLAYNFDLTSFEVFISADKEVLAFGKVKDAGRLN